MNGGVLLCGLLVLLAACTPSREPLVVGTPTGMILLGASSTSEASVLPESTATESPEPGLPPEAWQEWPVVPEELSPAMLDVFQRGLDRGNQPTAFSKIGDGEISTVWFLNHYDFAPAYYDLGAYGELEDVIANFSGSFQRVSVAAGRGFSTTIILDPARADREFCVAVETPLECELRVQRPAYAFVSLGTNQGWYPEVFEPGLIQMVETLLERGVIPILATKADNLEGDHAINAIIASVAYDYNLPLWNFWRVVQPLNNHGLQADMEHLTYAGSDFGSEVNMQNAWPWRNLTALQTLRFVWQRTLSQP